MALYFALPPALLLACPSGAQSRHVSLFINGPLSLLLTYNTTFLSQTTPGPCHPVNPAYTFYGGPPLSWHVINAKEAAGTREKPLLCALCSGCSGHLLLPFE